MVEASIGGWSDGGLFQSFRVEISQAGNKSLLSIIHVDFTFILQMINVLLPELLALEGEALALDSASGKRKSRPFIMVVIVNEKFH